MVCFLPSGLFKLSLIVQDLQGCTEQGGKSTLHNQESFVLCILSPKAPIPSLISVNGFFLARKVGELKSYQKRSKKASLLTILQQNKKGDGVGTG